LLCLEFVKNTSMNAIGRKTMINKASPYIEAPIKKEYSILLSLPLRGKCKGVHVDH